MFDPRRLLHALYVGRLFLAAALLLAALSIWRDPKGDAPVIASAALALALAFTSVSFFLTEIRRRKPGTTFLSAQAVFDLFLVTAAVHITWSGGQPQFAPLFILVIAVSALLVTPAGVPLIASLGMVLYFADAMLGHGGDPDPSLFVQLVIFGVVAISSGVIAARLRAAGSKSDELAAELAAFRLRESDMERLSLRAERLEGIAEMSASLAHEIKNPLASIRSAVERRREGSERPRSERVGPPGASPLGISRLRADWCDAGGISQSHRDRA